jgi:hypothetical protein
LFGGDAGRLCCGLIGSTGSSKFCLRTAPSGIAVHSRKFEADPDTFYLKENKTRAFVNPNFKGAGFLDHEIQELLAAKHTLKELSAIFEAKAARSTPEDRITLSTPVTTSNEAIAIDTEEPEDTTVNRTLQPNFELDSPRFSSESAGKFAVPPHLSFDFDDEDLNPFATLAETHPSELVAILQAINISWG